MLTFGTKRHRPYQWRVRWSNGGKSWISSQIFLPPPSTQTKVLSLSFCFSVLLFFLQRRFVLGFYVVFFFFLLFNKRFWVFLRLSQNDAPVFLIKKLYAWKWVIQRIERNFKECLKKNVSKDTIRLFKIKLYTCHFFR